MIFSMLPNPPEASLRYFNLPNPSLIINRLRQITATTILEIRHKLTNSRVQRKEYYFLKFELYFFPKKFKKKIEKMFHGK